MTWGIPAASFVHLHVILSLVGIAAGLGVMLGLASNRQLGALTALFFATTILTSVTGFPIPPFGFDAARKIGVISLVLMAVALFAYFGQRLSGAWRWVYVVTALAALYLNVFVAIVQAFQKLPALQPLAPTQSEPPFLIAQAVALAVILALGEIAVRRFRPSLSPHVELARG